MATSPAGGMAKSLLLNTNLGVLPAQVINYLQFLGGYASLDLAHASKLGCKQMFAFLNGTAVTFYEIPHTIYDKNKHRYLSRCNNATTDH